MGHIGFAVSGVLPRQLSALLARDVLAANERGCEQNLAAVVRGEAA